MHDDNETIASLSKEIAGGLRNITAATRERVSVIMARHRLQTTEHEERWDALMAEAEEILSKYKK